MSDTFQRERERAYAWQRLGAVFEAPERAYCIHYALQRLRRDESDTTPPVAAIALCNIGTGEEHVFSISREAETAGIDLAAAVTPAQLLALEYSLLFNLNDFLSRQDGRLFVHWYMRDHRFGFQALEARYRKALAELADGIYGVRNVAAAAPFGFGAGMSPYPVHISDGRRIDLAEAIRLLYGIGPVGLRELAQSNELSLAEMIEGQHEPAAFAEGNHASLARSAGTKARLIAALSSLARLGTIKPARRPSPARATDGLRIFINYRREDTEAAANWLHLALSQKFGDDNVFIDTDDIPAGIDFEAFLRSQIDASDVFLVMIGRNWATAIDENGGSRLASAQDFVRREIRAALARGIPVIPVLVDGSAMPTEMQLPADLLPLRRRQAVELRTREFALDADRLIGKLREAHRVGRQISAHTGGLV